jgi:hypothetical protein
MKKSELIEKLNIIPGDPEIRIMNIEIETNGYCPTFEINDVEKIDNFVDSEGNDNDEKINEFIAIEFEDSKYILEEVKI